MEYSQLITFKYYNEKTRKIFRLGVSSGGVYNVFNNDNLPYFKITINGTKQNYKGKTAKKK